MDGTDSELCPVAVFGVMVLKFQVDVFTKVLVSSKHRDCMALSKM